MSKCIRLVTQFSPGCLVNQHNGQFRRFHDSLMWKERQQEKTYHRWFSIQTLTAQSIITYYFCLSTSLSFCLLLSFSQTETIAIQFWVQNWWWLRQQKLSGGSRWIYRMHDWVFPILSYSVPRISCFRFFADPPHNIPLPSLSLTFTSRFTFSESNNSDGRREWWCDDDVVMMCASLLDGVCLSIQEKEEYEWM